MSDDLRLGIAGLGEMGRLRLCTALELPGVQVVAIGATDVARAVEGVRNSGLQTVVCPYDEFFCRDDLDAVVVSGRTREHSDHAVRAIDRGWHVLVEKPSATTLVGCRRIGSAAMRDPTRIVAVGYMRRFDPAFLELKEYAQNRIGEVLAVHSANFERFPPSGDAYDVESGGLIVDMGVHDIDIARWILRADPVRAFARSETVTFAEVSEDNAYLTIEFDGGKVATVHISRSVDFGSNVQCQVVGTSGCVWLRAGRIEGSVGIVDRSERFELPVDYQARFREAFRLELASFVERCRGGRSDGATIADDYHALATCLAARESARTGAVVDIATFINQLGADDSHLAADGRSVPT